jgi:Ser-tRNA(Ala) deacylase AlaX
VSGNIRDGMLKSFGWDCLSLQPEKKEDCNGGCLVLFIKNRSMEEVVLNEAKKQYHEPMHTCEHILNQTLVRMFGCGRSVNAHIERKKSKCDYDLPQAPTAEQVEEITRTVNEVIGQQLPVWAELMSREEAAKIADLSKLPADASETLRVIRVGDYDACACIGQHVENTSEIGTFQIISHDYENGRWRVRFRLVSSL